MEIKFPDPHAHSRNDFSEHFLVNSSRNFCVCMHRNKYVSFFLLTFLKWVLLFIVSYSLHFFQLPIGG